ncbi:MAG: hypothetical protein QXJ09_06970 [Candidatus Caldarchaeum sp.]
MELFRAVDCVEYVGPEPRIPALPITIILHMPVQSSALRGLLSDLHVFKVVDGSEPKAGL